MITNSLILTSEQEEELIRVYPDFPVSVYLTDFSVPDYQIVSWHWHKDVQLCLMQRGIILLKTPGGSLSVSSGHGFFLNQQIVHTISPLTPDASYYCINFSPSLLFAGAGKSLSDAWLSPFSDAKSASFFSFNISHPDGAALAEHIRQILHRSELGRTEGWPFQIFSHLAESWPILLRLLQKSDPTANELPDFSHANDRLLRILQFLQTHYSQKISLSDLSREISLCPEECERFFKRMTGYTPFQYLLEYRIKKSREFLSGSQLSIAEIAQNSGFASQSYYASCFRRMTGCTPKEYRQSHRTI